MPRPPVSNFARHGHDAAAHEDHRHDDDEAEQQVLIFLEHGQHLRQRHQHGGADDAAQHRAEPAQHHHGDELDGVQEAGLIRIDEAVHQRQHRARQ